MPHHPLVATLLTLTLAVSITGTARAIADADDLGQWNKPTNIGPVNPLFPFHIPALQGVLRAG